MAEPEEQKRTAVIYPFHQSDISLSSTSWGPPDELAFGIEMSGLFRIPTRNAGAGGDSEESSIRTATKAIVDAFRESGTLTIGDMADVGGVNGRRCYDIAHVLDWAGLITKRTGPLGGAYLWIGGTGAATLQEVRQRNEQLRAEIGAMDAILRVLGEGRAGDRLQSN
jgi:hypothetical protein